MWQLGGMLCADLGDLKKRAVVLTQTSLQEKKQEQQKNACFTLELKDELFLLLLVFFFT